MVKNGDIVRKRRLREYQTWHVHQYQWPWVTLKAFKLFETFLHYVPWNIKHALPCLALRHPVCRTHTGPLIDANLLCQGSALVLPPKTGQFPSGLVVWCQANFSRVFPAFAFCCLPPNIWPVLAICYHPSARRVLAIRVFFLWLNVCSVVFFLTSLFLTLSHHEMPSIRRWNFWCAASNFFSCDR